MDLAAPLAWRQSERLQGETVPQGAAQDHSADGPWWFRGKPGYQ